jgi:transposase
MGMADIATVLFGEFLKFDAEDPRWPDRDRFVISNGHGSMLLYAREAVTRPTMRFVPTKTMEQQSVLMLHKVRDLLIKQRTMLINALRSHLAEFGIVSAQGPAGLQAAIVSLHEMQDQWPELARAALHGIVDQLRDLARQIEKAETRLQAWHRKDEISRRLAQVPGIGPITASAIVATVPDASIFRSGRQFAAWLGLTPKAHSSGGKEKLGAISKQGDSYLRRLLVVGATSVIRVARKETSSKLWATRLLERKPARVVSVALANKTARIVWAMLKRGEDYGAPPPAMVA